MAWDCFDETVNVLLDGLTPVPGAPTPGQTLPAAVFRGSRFGAVLFLRLRRDGVWASDSAVTERSATGWWGPSSCESGEWIDPFPRPEKGWGGEPLLLLAGRDEQDEGSTYVTVEGMTAGCVASIRCETPTAALVYPVDSPVGAFIIVIEGDSYPVLTPFDAGGLEI